MSGWGRVGVPVVAGYLLGSVPMADVVARRRSVDLRAAGDGNPGYWNASALLGREAARPILAGDIAKGAAAAAVGRLTGGANWRPAVAGGAAAMVGHAFPLFARFRGGRAVATFIGAATVVSPRPAAVALGAGTLAGVAFRSFPRGVHAGFGAYPLAQLAIDGRARTAATGMMMTFIGLRFLTARTPAPATDGGA